MSQNSKQAQKETISNNMAIANPLNSLVAKSQQTLEEILSDKTISASERAEIALRILQIANSTNKLEQTNTINKNGKSLIEVSKESISKLPSQVKSKFFPAQYLQIDNFLSSEEYQQVLNTALNNQEKFVSSKTVTNTANYRQSQILYATLFSELYYSVKNKLVDTLPLLLSKLNHPEFVISHVEMQMTAHNDGCFYKVHNDAGSEKTKTRELTYVYYFYQEPKKFSGGELKLYDTEMQGGSFIQKENSETIEPRNNSIIFFNSRCKHEVLPISCAFGNFENSRFTLNGWLRS